MKDTQGIGVRKRQNFSKIGTLVDFPNLIEIQRDSYGRFLQDQVPPEQRQDLGLQSAFSGVFPIVDYNNTAMIEFIDYSLSQPKYDVHECLERGMTFAVPLKIRVRLHLFEKDEKTGSKRIKESKESEVYLGELPLMTGTGTFIINGTERVVVSQLHRSPGVSFTHDKGATHTSGRVLFSARVIPYRGSWLDFEFDSRDILYVRIDRRRKMPATILLKAFGFTTEDLLRMFYPVVQIKIQKGKFSRVLSYELKEGEKAPLAILDKKTKNVLIREGTKITKEHLSKIKKAGLQEIPVSMEELSGKVLLDDLVDPELGKVILLRNKELTEEVIQIISRSKIQAFKAIYIEPMVVPPVIRDTLAAEKVASTEEATVEIYTRLRPGETPTVDTAKDLFENLFFNSKRYDLSPVGRLKLNKRFSNKSFAVSSMARSESLSASFTDHPGFPLRMTRGRLIPAAGFYFPPGSFLIGDPGWILSLIRGIFSMSGLTAVEKCPPPSS